MRSLYAPKIEEGSVDGEVLLVLAASLDHGGLKNFFGMGFGGRAKFFAAINNLKG